ncbi:hypothetical protein MtrunA17_Chr5g0407031 [Medicago truncatula]|uniref:Uncharacterized protein n=1 Tax=Medicago truncatula TaxID=3880 RepID=A0A396HRC8_MEDTR|nr:hypothetical protein MtrunA17_Chr5g0407031 [Medicago truncatula]
MKGNNQKASDKEEQQDEKAGAVNQIKKRYGFSSSSNGVELRTAEMENTAKSFLSMAKQVLQNAEQDKRS